MLLSDKLKNLSDIGELSDQYYKLINSQIDLLLSQFKHIEKKGVWQETKLVKQVNITESEII